MSQRPHPRSAEFATWFADRLANAVPLAGEFYRAAGPRRITAAEILSGVGASIAGGRWNPLGVMKVVYLSVKPETALGESVEHFRRNNLPVWKGMPKVVVGVRVSVARSLDLTATGLGGDLPESLAVLMAEDWRAIMERGDEATAQAFGRAAFQAGVQALLVPSKPDPTGVNVLVFPERLTAADALAVLNAEVLDKLGGPM